MNFKNGEHGIKMSRRTIKMDQIRSVEATLHDYISSGFGQAQVGAIVQDESAETLRKDMQDDFNRIVRGRF